MRTTTLLNPPTRKDGTMFSTLSSSTITNNSSLKGQLASRKETFGENSRYAVAAVHTRGEEVSFFVWDAETMDDLGSPKVIRQEESHEAAVSGLG